MRKTYVAMGAFLFASVWMYGVIAGASAAPGEAEYLNPQNESYHINESEMRDPGPIANETVPDRLRDPLPFGGHDLWGLGTAFRGGMQETANILLVGAIHIANAGISLGQSLHWVPDSVFTFIADAWTLVGLVGLGGALYFDMKEVLA